MNLKPAGPGPEIQFAGKWVMVEIDQRAQETGTAFSEMAAAARGFKQEFPAIRRRFNTSQGGFHPLANEGIRDVRCIEIETLFLQDFPLVAKITGK